VWAYHLRVKLAYDSNLFDIWLSTSDATIYRANDISSRYWPCRIISISSRKISKFRYIVIVLISFQYR